MKFLCKITLIEDRYWIFIYVCWIS
jgi:hypothetical protein